MKVFGFVPVKGHSRRYPDKNFKGFCGETLISNTIYKLLEVVDMVYISSDTPYRAAQSLDGLEADPRIRYITRPTMLANDCTLQEDVVVDMINQIGAKENYNIILTQVTSPLWRVRTMATAVGVFEEHSYDTLVSTTFDYVPNGAFYIFNKKRFLENPKIYTENIGVYPMSADESIDIDYEYQHRIAEAICREHIHRGGV